MGSLMDKLIHYCWFGENQIDSLGHRCIRSWEKYCPDYKIILWNESNFDLNCCEYVAHAAREKKWAFVSDYARVFVVHKYGGLYFDTDVELIRSIDDIVARGPFLAFETDPTANKDGTVNMGLGFGAEPGMKLLKDLLEGYERSVFDDNCAASNSYTIVKRLDDLLKGYGVTQLSGQQQIAGFTIYPSEFFNPKDASTGKVSITDSTRSIHHFNASWYTQSEKRVLSRKYELCKKFPHINAKTASLFAKLECGLFDGDWDPWVKLFKDRLR